MITKSYYAVRCTETGLLVPYKGRRYSNTRLNLSDCSDIHIRLFMSKKAAERFIKDWYMGARQNKYISKKMLDGSRIKHMDSVVITPDPERQKYKLEPVKVEIRLC